MYIFPSNLNGLFKGLGQVEASDLDLQGQIGPRTSKIL